MEQILHLINTLNRAGYAVAFSNDPRGTSFAILHDNQIKHAEIITAEDMQYKKIDAVFKDFLVDFILKNIL